MDCEQIATGTYSPISGFMDRETLDSVLETNRLPSGLIWTTPVISTGNHLLCLDYQRNLPGKIDAIRMTGIVQIKPLGKRLVSNTESRVFFDP